MRVWRFLREYVEWCDFVRALGAQCRPPVQLKITVDDQQARDQLERLGWSLDQFSEAFDRFYRKGVYSDPVISNWSHVIDSTK